MSIETIDKHTEYKRFICDYLNDNYGQAWSWENIPDEHLVDFVVEHNSRVNIWNKLKDKKWINTSPKSNVDVDILFLNKEKKYILIKCVCKHEVTIEDLGGLFHIMMKNKKLEGILYYTNYLSEDVKSFQQKKQQIFNVTLENKNI
jgi:hypothetical protein